LFKFLPCKLAYSGSVEYVDKGRVSQDKLERRV